MSGKWDDPTVPKRGWTCTSIADLGDDWEDAGYTCEMCEAQVIRYVHTMEHPAYKPLDAGCECAGRMEEDMKAAKGRDRDAKNRANRRQKWLMRQWQWCHDGYLNTRWGWSRICECSAGGCFYISTDGCRVAIYKYQNGRWGYSVLHRRTDKTVKSTQTYATVEEIKLASFDALMGVLHPTAVLVQAPPPRMVPVQAQAQAPIRKVPVDPAQAELNELTGLA